MGSTSSEIAALESLTLARKIWGNPSDPVMISLVDSLSPLHTQWQQMELRESDRRAGQILRNRLSAYQKPDIDPPLERELIKYVDQRKVNQSSIIQ